ncbi:hypothetical protein AAE478_007294 [Parahypoxylon ruwenzoriense]
MLLLSTFLLQLPFVASVVRASCTHNAKGGRELARCADLSAPTAFSIKGLSYLKYEVYPSTGPTQPNSTQLAFVIVNQANGIPAGCSLQNVMVSGHYGDDSNYWYPCQDRILTTDDGHEYPIKTSAHVIWDAWKLTVNQTWTCDGDAVVRQISTLTVASTCTETKSAFQFMNECTAPDVNISATLQ